MSINIKEKDSKNNFEIKRKYLLPTLMFCAIFFLFYYVVLIIPKFGIQSEVFFIDNMGGLSIVIGFVSSIFLTRFYKLDTLLLIPSFATTISASIFLVHEGFYSEVDHLWLSAQVIGIIFATFLGTPKLNCLLFFLNISIPLVIASQTDHLNFQDIAIKQAIIHFASLTSIYLAYSSQEKLLEEEKRNRDHEAILKDALEKKKVSEFLLNQTNQIAKIGGWSLDLSTNKLWWSDQTYLIHEIPIGQQVDISEAINYYAEEARPIITEAVNTAIENGTGWDLELPFVTAKNNSIWVRAVGICHTNPDGSKTLRGTFQDITEKKIYEEKLTLARDEALKASAARSIFLANMSHEIRTPMNGVLGNAELLIDEDLTDSQKKIVSTIIKSGESMMQILNDILDFSKIDAAQIHLENHDFSLREQLQSIYDLYEFEASKKNIIFNLEIDHKTPDLIHTDSTRIRQILSNLISNAIKFTQNGHVSLRVKSNVNQKGEHIFRFEVEDSGIGIEEEFLKNMFTEFTQADLSTTRKFGGTGLGLAICQKLANLFGSQIKVKSSRGKGSLFFFDLKLNLSQSFEKKNHKHHEDIPTKPLSHLKVLLVEDNSINLELAMNFLMKIGITCTIAQNGKEAVDAVKDSDYDIVFMDCQMPVMDGYSATQQIRSLNIETQPVIIAMTANAMSGDKEKCIDSGMDDYITKPISKSKLKITLEKWSITST